MIRAQVACPACAVPLPFDRWIPGPWSPDHREGERVLPDRYSCPRCLAIVRVEGPVHLSSDGERFRDAVLETEGAAVAFTADRLRRAAESDRLLAEIETLQGHERDWMLLRVPEVFQAARYAFPADLVLTTDAVWIPETRLLAPERDLREWDPNRGYQLDSALRFPTGFHVRRRFPRHSWLRVTPERRLSLRAPESLGVTLDLVRAAL